MARRRKRDEDYDRDDKEELEPRRTRHKRTVRRFGFRRLLVFGFLALVVVAALLPRIAALPVFRSMLLGVASNQLNGKVEIDELSLGWFAPIQVGNLRIKDTQGNVVATVAKLRTEKSLSSLAWNRNDLGSIEIEKPAVNLVIRPGGSNLEDVLAKIMSGESPGNSSLPKATIKLIDGTVQLSGPNSAQPIPLSGINGQAIAGGPDAQLTFTTTAIVQSKIGTLGQIQLDGKAGAPGSVADFGSGQLVVHAQNTPIDIAAIALTRLGQSADCQGQLVGDTTLTWSNGGREATVDLNNVHLNQFALTAPQWLSSDRLVVDQLQTSGRMKMVDTKLVAEQFKCQTEFASVEATGEVDWQMIAQSLAGGQLPQSDFQIGGTLDLARVTQMLPNTMRLKPGVQIQKANFNFQSFSRLEGNRRRLFFNGEAKDFAGVHDGQAIRWTKPIRLSAALIQDGQRTALESIQCETNSISITGQSDVTTGQIRAKGDLGQLQTELEQFFSMGEIALAGRFDGTMSWNMDQAALVAATSWPVKLDGDFNFEALEIAIPGMERFVEPKANVQFAAQGQATRAGQVRIDAGNFDLVAGSDQLKAQLLQPIENPTLNSAINAQCNITGGLASWLQRLGPVMPKLDFRAAGTVGLEGNATINRSSARLQTAKYELNEFAFDGFGMQIREPKVAGEGDIAFDWSNPRLHVADLTLTSSTIAGRGANLDLTMDSTGFQLTGELAYRADVNRVSHWFGIGQAADSMQWFGAAEGTAQLTPAANSVAGTINTKIGDLTIAKMKANAAANDPNPWEIVWQEPSAQLNSQMAIDPSWDKVDLQSITVQSKAIQVDGKGTIADLAKSLQLDLTGQWVPNWEAISAIAQGYAGKSIELRGQPRAESFRVQGPLFATDPNNKSFISPQLVAETSASWDGGQLLGMAVGPATIKANLKDAVLGFNDPQIQIGPGRVHFNPLLDMRGDPQLILTRGPVLETVDLTPEICQGWFKFVAPLLAEATRARGKFSLIVDGAQVPLFQPMTGRASGQLVIEQATIEPGPLGQQLIQLVNTVKQMADGNPLDALLKSGAASALSPATQEAWLQMPAQQIGFKMEQNQFIHDGMTLDIKGVQVKTRGAIGTDSSLNLVAEIPISDSWIQKQPALAGLKGQSLQIPIGGSLTQPRLDNRALAQLSAQLFQKAAGGQIESRLNGLLNDTLQKNLPQLPAGTGGLPAQPASSTTPLQPIGDTLQKSVEGNLIKGLDRLLGPKK